MSQKQYELEDVVAEHKGKMKYVRLGTSGLRISAISLGMMSYGDKKWNEWILEEEEALPLIKAAYDCGINLFDTADIYSLRTSEIITGRAIKKYNMQRESLVVATKLFNFSDPRGGNDELPNGKSAAEIEAEHYTNMRGLSRKHIFDSVDKSLKALDLEYIDLLQIHRADPNVSPEETMKALHDIVESGKVHYIGASSMFAWEFSRYQYTAKMNGWTPFVSMQNYYCASYREEEREMLPCIDSFGVTSLPWSPLGGGCLARPVGGEGTTSRGKGKEYHPAETAVSQAIEKVSKAKGIPMAQIALAWLHKNPTVSSPIVGISNARALNDACASVHVQLTEAEVKAIEAAYVLRAIEGHEYVPNYGV